MFGFILGLTARTHYALRGYLPTNVLLDAIHTRRGLKWGVPAMLLSVPYALAAILCAGLVQAGGSGWLNLLVLLFAWNAVKIFIAGAMALMRLFLVRRGEARAGGREPWGTHLATADHWSVPQVTFTDPEVGAVALTEAAAVPAGIHSRTVDYDIGWVAGARVQRDKYPGMANGGR